MSAFDTARLADMRAAADEATMSDRGKRTAAQAIGRVEADWYVKHRDAYEQALIARDAEHDVVVEASAAFVEQLRQAKEDLRAGRREPDAVRAWLRDVDADFRRLTEAHQGVIASDDRLGEFVQMSPDAYQAEQFARFPRLETTAPTLTQVLGQITEGRRTRAVSREQIDAEQAEIARVLRR